MSEDPKFDIYPQLEREIKAATGARDGAKPEDLAVGGLTGVIEQTIGKESTNYPTAQKQVEQLFKGFPENIHISIRPHTIGSPEEIYHVHKVRGTDIDKKIDKIEYHLEGLENRNWFAKHLLPTSKADKNWLKRTETALEKDRAPYNVTLEEGKAVAEKSHAEALALEVMTGKYNQISHRLHEDYGLAAAADIKPDKLLENINREDVERRSWIDGSTGRKVHSGSSDLQDWAIKDQTIIIALKDFFAPKQDIQAENGKGPMKPDQRLADSSMCLGRSNAEGKADDMDSHFMLRVRQAVDNRRQGLNGLPAESFVPLSNFAAALIQYLQYKDRIAISHGGDVNIAQFLDCKVFYGSLADFAHRHEGSATFDLIDLADSGSQQNLEALHGRAA